MNNRLKEYESLLELKESELEALRQKTVEFKLKSKELESELVQKEQNISELLKHIYVE